MPEKDCGFWFPLKLYGWGWGLPVRWQGWCVLALYIILLFAGIEYSRVDANSAFLPLYVGALTLVLLVIVVWKGERPPRWRLGGE
jgi:hypothetical protein